MGAAVELVRSATQSFTVFTNERGFYSARGLTPGSYFIRITAPAFLPVLRESVNLRAGASTVLNVTLTERGNVKEIFVEKSCGVDFLDLEAIQSFERAQPFPNPPPGLVQNDTSVKFSFGFFLEMSGAPRMRLFRGNN